MPYLLEPSEGFRKAVRPGLELERRQSAMHPRQAVRLLGSRKGFKRSLVNVHTGIETEDINFGTHLSHHLQELGGVYSVLVNTVWLHHSPLWEEILLFLVEL